LNVAGLPEFLDNCDEATASFSSVMDELAALAEAAVSGQRDGFAISVHPGGQGD
jgi:hypothetical protein